MTMAKYSRRAQKKLDARVKAYNETVKTRSDHGKGFRKPGSSKTKPN